MQSLNFGTGLNGFIILKFMKSPQTEERKLIAKISGLSIAIC